MTELLTAKEMRTVEKKAIENGRASGLELMERAGRGVVSAMFAEWPALARSPHRAAVIAGPGNNGGDGFVVARLLHERGWSVLVHFLGERDRLPPEAKVNHDKWSAIGGILAFPEVAPDPDSVEVVVDAGFGTGLSRPIDSDLIEAFLRSTIKSSMTKDKGPLVVAVDVPTGLSSDTGRPIPKSVAADLTVTFHRPRPGHVLAPGPDYVGRLAVVSIGLEGCDPAETRTAELVEALAPQVLNKAGHKYTNGHAVVLTGGLGRGGAARLAARGALRIGAGLVTVACPQVAVYENAARLDAIMVRVIDGGPGLAELLEDRRLNALCLGPGLGLGADTAQIVLAALAADRATVLDADALMRFERAPASLFEALHARCVLTPHEGEFRRLFPDIATRLTDDPTYSKIDATRDAAARAGCTVLFKGPDTVIASSDGGAKIHAAVRERSSPWLATAGAGDVLAGFVTGLLARGFEPLAAAEAAVKLHVDCALHFGPGLIAEDLPETLPKVLSALEPEMTGD